MDHEQAELHTPPLNKIGLPEGLAEYSVRKAIRDIIDLYGQFHGEEIVEAILDQESRRRPAQ